MAISRGAKIVGGTSAILGLALLVRSRSTRNRIASYAAATVTYPRTHAINKMVTQGRAFYKGYSGCGDLWNYVLDKVGAPDSWVNLDSKKRGMKWKVEVNISKPWGAAKRAGAVVKWKPGGRLPNKGDLVLIGLNPGDAHVFVVLGRKGNVLKTAEYGGPNNLGRLGKRTINLKTGKVTPDVFNRRLVGWIDADKIPVKK